VTLSLAGAEVQAKVQVTAGEDKVQRVVLKGGEVDLSARLGPQSPAFDNWHDTSWTVEAIAAAGVAAGTKAADGLAEATPKLTLAPGRWHIVVESGTATAEREVAVTPESITPVVLDVNAARLTTHAVPADPATASANVVTSFFPIGADGTPAADAAYDGGSPSDMEIILPAGRWHITALDSDNRQATADVELKAGEERSIDLTLQ
jgi:hypothetical protein